MTHTTSSYNPDRFRRYYVESPGELSEVARVLSRAEAVGVDIEMGQRMLRRPGGIQEWKHYLALLQIASDDLSVVVDPLRCDDLTSLAPLLAGPMRKVLLGGGQDVALLAENGLPVRTIADVGEVAYAIFGRREDGMAALSRRIFGLELDKTVRRTDWLVRPLNPQLIIYAHRDAELTLQIYHWFQEHYPDVLRLHERLELEPEIPPSVSPWLRDALTRSSADAGTLVQEHDLDPEKQADRLDADMRHAMGLFGDAPRRINRLIRIAGDLGLRSLLPEVIPMTESPSSLIRASAARAVGKLADREEGRALLEPMKQDQIDDVRKAVDSALRDLKSREKTSHNGAEESADDPAPALNAESLAALQNLMQRLGEPEQ